MGRRRNKKRNDRKRKQKLARRAERITTDTSELHRVAEREPARAAEAMIVRLRGAEASAEDGRPTLIADAARVCAALRRTGYAEHARRVAGAVPDIGAADAVALRLEEALACFSLGDDEACVRIARSDPAVERVVAPLLEASVGGGGARSRELDALHAAARAALHARWSETGKARNVAERCRRTPSGRA